MDRPGTCIILDKKYNIANSSCHFGSYGSIWTGPSPKKYFMQGRIQDFKLGGGAHFKKIAPNGGRRENFGGISCEKSPFYAKKIISFPILGGSAPGAPPPPPPPHWIRP